MNTYFILVNPYLFRESKSVQDIIEMIKKGNCIIISDVYNSYDEDSILDIDIHQDFLLKDVIRSEFGMYVAMSIAQGGYGFPILHPIVYNDIIRVYILVFH